MATINVKVVSKNSKLLPLNFPWTNGVDFYTKYDIKTVDGMMKEMQEIKASVHADVQRYGITLKNVDILIDFK